MTLLVFAFLLSCLLNSNEAKVYSRCELARVLRDFGLDGYRGYSLADCENTFPLLLTGLWLLPPLPLSLLLVQGVWPSGGAF